MKELLQTRNEVVHNLVAVERPKELKDELLDTIYEIDRSLGANALFAAQRQWYAAPPVATQHGFESHLIQSNEQVLF